MHSPSYRRPKSTSFASDMIRTAVAGYSYGCEEEVRRSVGREQMGVAISGEQYLWPGGTVPYVIDPSFTDVDGVTAAVEHWNEHSVVRFVARGTEPDYVVVTSVPGGANSDVGRRGGEQHVC